MTGGLPHSEIRGSKGIRPSPRLIAAYHVLHRLLSPRHSPNALIALDPIQKKTESFAVPYELGGNYHFLQCSCEHRAPLPCSESLIFEPDDQRLASRAVVVFPDQCQDLCKRSSYGDSPRAPFQCFLDRSRGGHTIPRDRYSSLYDVIECSAPFSGNGKRNERIRVVGSRKTCAYRQASEMALSPFALRAIGCRADDFGLQPKSWWVEEDLNLRPRPYQGRALTN